MVSIHHTLLKHIIEINHNILYGILLYHAYHIYIPHDDNILLNNTSIVYIYIPYMYNMKYIYIWYTVII